MALISTFPSDPADRAYFRKIDTALTVTYSRQRISGSWGWFNGLNGGGTINFMFEYRRHASKRYRYVGMTDEAKNECVRALQDLYTRRSWTNYWNSNGSWSGTTECGDILTANITPVSNDDGSWDVEVDVNEDDIRYSLVGGTIPAKSMFHSVYEPSRDYDGETEADLEPQAS